MLEMALRRRSGRNVKIKITAAGERSFLPVPAEIPVCGHNPATIWSEALTRRLSIQNAPPHRLILLDGEMVFRYRLDNQVEERFLLLHLIANGWITARALARRWGVSRNTIGNWSWRYRFFGLDGLVDGRLPPEREVLQQLLSTGQAILCASPRLSLAALGRALEQAGYRELPPATLRALRAALAETPALHSAAVEMLPAPAVVQSTPLRYAGLALVLPILQEFFTPEIRRSWGRLWGQRAWLYRPVELVTAFVLQILCGFLNPEQVKAAPAEALGPLLGHHRSPATVTFRHRLPAMARDAAQVEAVGDELALQYLRLGGVQLDWWAIDNHFVPYFGRHDWGKTWWTQRRYAHPGHCQTAVHDAQGRPLLLRFSQAFELFQDEVPATAHRVQAPLQRLGEAHPHDHRLRSRGRAGPRLPRPGRVAHPVAVVSPRVRALAPGGLPAPD